MVTTVIKWARNSAKTILTPPTDSAIDAGVQANYRRNFTINVLDMSTWIVGDSFISLVTILPVFASKLASTPEQAPLLVGLIPALFNLGFFLPQLFVASFVERSRAVKPVLMVAAGLQRLTYVGLPLLALLVGRIPNELAAGLFLLIILLTGIMSGVAVTPWQTLIAKLIPVARRGVFFGLPNIIGKLLGLGGSALALWILSTLPFPQNFALCFGIGVSLMGLSMIFLSQNVEPASITTTANKPRDPYYWKRLREILVRDSNFRAYIVSRWLAHLGMMATGFLAVYAIDTFKLPASQSALFTGVLLITAMLGNALGGYFGDLRGYKYLTVISASLWIAALATYLAAAFTRWEGFVYLGFFLFGLSTATEQLAELNMVMEFGTDAERPTYIGLARTITGPAPLVAPLIAAVVVQQLGYLALFLIALGFALVGIAVFITQVTDPRRVTSSSA